MMDQLNVQEQPESQKLMELSLYSIARFTTKKPLKVWGTIFGKKDIVLIDRGASANFISCNVAEELGLKQTETKSFVVEVVNRQQCQCCVGIRVAGDFGGNIQDNFKTLTLKFEIGGQTQVVRGDPSLSKSVASLKTLFKAL
ncbi:hypothetical protein KY290_026015 [Solanum tuberosum]|uniref:Uncharacterized protein n=1 Tax=Solanum tuberosum TaxID=4113 RepID=A0ABQ7UV70_SOLTU|nr:hypothetical protein KY289_025948 [Solanum tuberosum]KAH0673806.1 hypothetical protein KY284_024893 [Solanum tuberosum]KAH0677091.1 hypothetical protein KY285_024892 [Solanum tuberosum]KAH0755745.1 hypothetical protein KY290_026015 [Solanum tuberosum]